MTRSFLVFQLYGPMTAWGDPAVGEMRPTENRPSRSALLGLLAAALGLRHDEDAQHHALGASVRFGVAVDAVGVPLADYHTIQFGKPKRGQRFATRRDQLNGPTHELSTLLSERHYRCDAEYRVATWSAGTDGPWSLDDLRRALERPLFVLYLGRKSCPLALPLAPKIIEAETLVDVFSAYAVRTAGHPPTPASRRGPEPRLLCWEGEDAIAGVVPSRRIERRDEPLARSRRTFGRRYENQGTLVEES